MTTAFYNGVLTFRPDSSSKELTPDAIREGFTKSAGQLTGLSFPQVHLTETAVRFLIDQSELVMVDRLYLNSAVATSKDLALLFSSPGWTGLRRLEVQGLAITPEAAVALASNPALANLYEVNLWIREAMEAVLSALSGSESVLSGLTKPSMIGRGLNAAGMRHLLTAETLTSLNHLAIMLPPQDWRDLDEPLAIPLRELNILANTDFALGVAGCSALADLHWLQSLTALRIMPNHHIGPEGAQALMASPHLTGLEELVLAFNGIRDVGLEPVGEPAGRATPGVLSRPSSKSSRKK